MSTTVSLNGSNHSIPAVGERNWGINVTNYLIAIASGVLQRSGGSQPLTADLNLGTSYGLVAKYLKSTGSNIATAGVLMLANSESIGWRDNANSADKLLKVNTSDRLEYDGYNLVTINSTDTLTNKTLTAPVIASIVNTGTLTLPSSTDTLVGRATTDTLTNKTLTAPVISTISNTGTLTLPTSTDTLVGRATTDTLTNKTLDAPVVDNGLTMNHESTPATPSAGVVKVYPKSDNSLYILDSSGVETQVGSGTGQGEKNYITNPSAQSALNGWVISGAGTLARTTTAANLPREFTTGTALSFTSSTDEEYVRFRFSLDDVDLAKKLKWVLDYISSTANFRLEMWKNSASNYGGSYTEIALENDVSGDSYLVAAAASANYRTTFDTDTTPYLELRIVHNGTGTDTIYFSDVLVGPGTIGTVPAIGNWQSYTPTLTNYGTTSTNTGFWRQNGPMMEIRCRQVLTGAGSAGSIRIGIPSGYTIDSTIAPLFTTSVLGVGEYFNGSTFQLGDIYPYTNTTVSVLLHGSSNDIQGNALASGHQIGFTISIPIAEWAGSVQTGPVPAEEFAYNSDVTSTANPSSNGALSSSVIGSFGVVFASAWAVGTNYQRRVRFQYPIQNDDVIALEIFNPATGVWTDLAARIGALINTTSTYNYGANFYAPTGGDVRDIEVSFANGGYAPPSGFGTATGAAWSSLNAGGFKWRLRKTRKASLPYRNAGQGVSGLLNYYMEEDANYTFQGSLGGSASSAVTVKVTRIGRVVTIDVPSFTNVTPTSNSTALVSTTNLPTWARPTGGLKIVLTQAYNGSAWVTTGSGVLAVTTGGQLQFYKDLANTAYTNSSAAGWYHTQITYTV